MTRIHDPGGIAVGGSDGLSAMLRGLGMSVGTGACLSKLSRGCDVIYHAAWTERIFQ